MANKILAAPESHNILIEDCRSQGYDNGSNMSGILNENQTALFSPCGAHSLNLTGKKAAKMNADAMKFFENIEAFYSFHCSSSGRWETLKEYVPLSLQNLTNTRWSERLQAVRPIVKHYPGVLKVFNLILEE